MYHIVLCTAIVFSLVTCHWSNLLLNCQTCKTCHQHRPDSILCIARRMCGGHQHAIIWAIINIDGLIPTPKMCLPTGRLNCAETSLIEAHVTRILIRCVTMRNVRYVALLSITPERIWVAVFGAGKYVITIFIYGWNKLEFVSIAIFNETDFWSIG